jgi:hypothetical protein
MMNIQSRSAKSAGKKPLLIGWREVVGLPELGLPAMHAKIDTGARTTALHAGHVRAFDQDGARWVEFTPPRVGKAPALRCRLPVADEREVKNTSGVPELRIIVRATLVIGGRRWKIDLSLADRTKMTFPIIIGRSAIRRHGLLVDCGRSYLAGEPGVKLAQD